MTTQRTLYDIKVTMIYLLDRAGEDEVAIFPPMGLNYRSTNSALTQLRKKHRCSKIDTVLTNPFALRNHATG